MNSPRDTLTRFTDAAADAVARAIAGIQRDAQRERELRDAEHRARLAELDTRILAVADIERQVTSRLATLKDGEPGRDGVDGKDGEPGEPGKDGVDGKDIDPEEVKAAIVAHIAMYVDATLMGWERPQDGKSVTAEELAPLIEESAQRAVSAISVPKDGADGRDGKDGEPGEKGEPGDKGERGDPGERGDVGPAGADGRDGADGKDGERGAEGPGGKLPIVHAWADKVHYDGEVVTHAGASFQALRDTAKEPPHDDWICLARAGSDGRSFTIRGTWSEADEYHVLDVVALGGASFAARRDNPGACPGEGWQLIAAQGKRGNPGERGKEGIRGSAGPQIVRMAVDDNALLTLANEDGTEITCDLYPLLSKL